jgi:hypothetical protein
VLEAQSLFPVCALYLVRCNMNRVRVSCPGLLRFEIIIMSFFFGIATRQALFIMIIFYQMQWPSVARASPRERVFLVLCSLTSAQLTLRPPPDTLRQGYALETCRSPSHRAPFHMPASK